MRKPSHHTYRLLCLSLALAALLSGLAWPGHSGGRQLTDQAAIPRLTNPNWVATGSLNAGRANHTATLLPDGKVLVAGGSGWSCTGNFCFSTTFDTAELYEPATGTWRLTENVGRRTYHTATLLPNGQVLIAGGANYGYDVGAWIVDNSALLYDPATGRWRPTGNLIMGRHDHTATLLPNGQVLIVGGSSFNSEARSAELYDPVTEMWSSASAPATIAKDHVATLLPNGKVLAASGNSAELYDPATGQWSAINPPRALGVAYTATLLANGQVLVTGTRGSFSAVTTAELYNPATGEWTMTTPIGGVGSWHTATLLPDGRVLITGGVGSDDGAISSAEIYDPASGTWSLTSPLDPPRGLHKATLLFDGRVLVAGGFSAGAFSDSQDNRKDAVLFDLGLPQSGTVTNVSAASFRLTGLTSEAVAAGFGSGLATATSRATTLPLPTELGGTTVKVKDSAGSERLAPLFSVSPTQVNYQVPPGTATGAASVTITSGNGTVSTGAALIHTVAPSLFAANADGKGVAAAVALRIKADGSQQYEPVAQFDAAQNRFVALPLDLGLEGDQVYLVLFGCGIRQRSSLSAVTASIGGVYAEVSFAGAQGAFAGLDQVNLRLPRSLRGRGEVEALLTVDAQMANPLRIHLLAGANSTTVDLNVAVPIGGGPPVTIKITADVGGTLLERSNSNNVVTVKCP